MSPFGDDHSDDRDSDESDFGAGDSGDGDWGENDSAASDSAYSEFTAEQFAGKARLFPLPNLAMFPHVMQPLHIFEPRYRQLIADAMSGDRLLAMALLAPGWEKDYDGRPPLEAAACLCRIASCQPLPDGRYNLLIVGLRRLEIVRELPPKFAYREAESRVIEDCYPAAAAAARPALQRSLIEAFKQVAADLAGASHQLDQLLASEVPLGMLTDIIGYSLELDMSFKLKLLAERSVDARAQLLLERLASSPEGGARRFPPGFSAN